MTKKFTIEITGGGREFGAGKITKTQYAYWQDGQWSYSSSDFEVGFNPSVD